MGRILQWITVPATWGNGSSMVSGSSDRDGSSGGTGGASGGMGRRVQSALPALALPAKAGFLGGGLAWGPGRGVLSLKTTLMQHRVPRRLLGLELAVYHVSVVVVNSKQ